MLDIVNKKAYFFDLDGTLVDSSPIHESAFRRVLAVHHPELCKSFNYELYKGKSTPSVFRELEIIKHEEVEYLTCEKRRLYLEEVYSGRVPVFSGAVELLRLLYSKRRKIYIVTSASKKAAQSIAATAGFLPYIDDIITSEDVKAGKPHPDIFYLALKRSKINPCDVIAIEDSLNGRIAAQTAGIDVVLINTKLDKNNQVNFQTLEELYLHVNNGFGQGDGPKKICAVIPAAGRGSRLGKDMPKIMVPLIKGMTIWHILYEKLRFMVDQIHVVLSPSGYSLLQQQIKRNHISPCVSMSIQQNPIGMGDAIFGASDYWKDYENILVIWGDQVFVSNETIKKTIEFHFSLKCPAFTIPVSFNAKPYVQYVFADNDTKLMNVRQTREGDVCENSGFADVGLFCLSTSNIIDAWRSYLARAPKGRNTGEINFLPFLPYLSTELGWRLKTVEVKDPDESRGINTESDIKYFLEKYKAQF